jgi:menaquinone-dependent protoporphyrinogen oxidase
MPAPRILIVYGTRYGQTAKIAARMRELLVRSGNDVTLVDGEHSHGLTPRGYAGAMLGSSVIAGRHHPDVADFVRANRAVLDTLPSAFFSVSGSAGSTLPAVRRAARELADQFLEELGWRPLLVETVAGAMAFTKYPPLVRWMLKRMSRQNWGPTDTSRDHELTDWSQVERFVRTFEARVAGGRRERALA